MATITTNFDHRPPPAYCYGVNDTPETIGQLVHELRLNAGYSLRELGSLAGCTNGTIANIERGRGHNPKKPYKPDRDTVANIAEVLGIDEQRMYDAYGIAGRRYVRFDVTGLSPSQVEKVRGYIDGLREK